MSDTGNFTAEERAAMKERAQEVRKSRGKAKKDEEPAVREKIAEMPGEDRARPHHRQGSRSGAAASPLVRHARVREGR
jgi:hypothetical protein